MWGEWEGHWRVRVGVYRVIYLIDDAGEVLLITRVGHRRSVYERQ